MRHFYDVYISTMLIRFAECVQVGGWISAQMVRKSLSLMEPEVLLTCLQDPVTG
jgi:hypothetical protein